MSRDSNDEEIDAPEAPDYEEPGEEAREYARSRGMSPDLPEWRHWDTWAKIRFLRRLRSEGAGRPEQYIDSSLEWYIWALWGGRGSGKSLEANAFSAEEGLRLPRIRTALVARTFSDVRDTIYEGETGLLAVIPDHELRGGSRERAYNRSLGELFLANGSKYKGFSAEKPSGLRGPQHHRAAIDEASSWEDADLGNQVDTTISNLLLGLRLKPPDGSGVRLTSSTTPKPNELTEFINDLAERKGQVRVLSTYSNLANLDEQVADVVIGMYEGTDVAAQELEGKILSAAKGAAFTDAMVASAKSVGVPSVGAGGSKVVIGVDPAVSSKETSDETGLVALERRFDEDEDPWVGVLGDLSGKIPAGAIAPVALAWAEQIEADEVAVEINNGYDFVVVAFTSWCEANEWNVVRRSRKDVRTSTRSKTRQVIEYLLEAPSGYVCLLRPVWSSTDKLTRAKAASVWWHRGRAWHAPDVDLALLEKQMTGFDGTGKKSPDRLDALSTAAASFAGTRRSGSARAGDPRLVEGGLPPAGAPVHPLLSAAAGNGASGYGLTY